MAKERTRPIRLDMVREIMDEKGISVGDLVKATGLSRKGVNNILDGTSAPRVDNLVMIAAALGVRWRTLVEGHVGEPEVAGGGVAIKTTVDIILDIRTGGMTEEEAIVALGVKLRGRIRNLDEVRIKVVRDDDEI